jgi:L-lactate dehydrogenase
LRALLGEQLGIAPTSVHAHVLGEHGDSEVIAWSAVEVAGMPLREFARQIGRGITDEVKARIDGDVRNAAYRIIQGKGATYFGIAAGLADIVRAIRDDERRIMTVSGLTRDVADFKGTCLSLPRLVGAGGILAEFRPDLSAEEMAALKRSAAVLEKAGAEVLGGVP